MKINEKFLFLKDIANEFKYTLFLSR